MRNYFLKKELECHGTNCCGHSAPTVPDLKIALNKFRELVGYAVYLSCAFRCLTYNRTLPSNDRSKHPKGRAADIQKVKGMSIRQMERLARTIPEIKVVIRYPWGIHVHV